MASYQHEDGMWEEWDDKEFDDGDDGEFEFDCGMYPDGQCGKAGSEECDFECPVMAEIHRDHARARAQKSAEQAAAFEARYGEPTIEAARADPNQMDLGL